MSETQELLGSLKSLDKEKELQRYLDNLQTNGYPATFAGYYDYMLKKKDLVKKDVVAASLLDRVYAYQIISGIRNAGRDKIFALCLAAGFNLEETQRALEIAKEGVLYAKNSRDSIIIYAINNKIDVMHTNFLLEKYKEKILE